MGAWTTNVRIGVGEYQTSHAPDEELAIAERRVRTALLGAAADPDITVAVGWQSVIPGTDRTASPFHVNGDTYLAWSPGEDIPDRATELVCRGRTVT